VVRIQDTVLRLANPRIVHGSGREWAEEGCLSVPGVNVKVPRFTQVEVKAIDPDNQEILFTAQGLLARVIQHEIDHLKGRLIVDYLPWYKRIMVKVKVRKARQ
jgi:peptide deformylase